MWAPARAAAPRGSPVGIVARMESPDGAGGSQDTPPGDRHQARTWVHPSEIGLRTRTRSDRRRSTWLSVGLIAAGIGLLGVGVVIGFSGGGRAEEPAQSATDAVSATLAQVTVVRPGGHVVVTGVIVDMHGHVAVPARALDGAQEIWASCAGRDATEVRSVTSDDGSGVAVLTMPSATGTPLVVAAPAQRGDRVLVARTGIGEAAPRIERGRIETAGAASVLTSWADRGSGRIRIVADGPRARSARTAPPSSGSGVASSAVSTTTSRGTSEVGADGIDGGAAFDGRGRFVGLVVPGSHGRGDVVPAATVVRVVDSLTP